MSWHCTAAVYLIQRSCLCRSFVTTELDKLYISRLKNQRGQWVCWISTSRYNAHNAGGRDHRALFMNTGYVSTPHTHFVRGGYKYNCGRSATGAERPFLIPSFIYYVGSFLFAGLCCRTSFSSQNSNDLSQCSSETVIRTPRHRRRMAQHAIRRGGTDNTYHSGK